MFFSVMYLSTNTAQEVSDAIAHFLRNEIENQYFVLQAAATTEGKPFKLELRPIIEQDLLPNADSSEIIHCITRTGSKVDVLLPHPKDRTLCPAGIILPEEGLTTE